MSLTAFQRYRRMKQVEEMKPENIVKNTEVKEVENTQEPVVEPKATEVQATTPRRRRRTTEE